MSSTVFVNGVTLSDSDWFNDLNTLHYTIFADPTSANDVRKKLWVKGADVASAGTITVPTDGNYFHITGTTTITAFSAVSNGYIVKVVFDGALNLTHNGTSFILPGGTSVLTVAGDAAEFVNESGANWRCINYISASTDGSPAGAILAYGGTAAPSGWVLCFGQAVSRTTFAGLFGVLSTSFGAGDGATTFNLPDLRGRAVFGKDNMGGSTASRVTATSGITGTTLGATGGDERSQSHTHTATVTDPTHTHDITQNVFTPTGPNIGLGTGNSPAGTQTIASAAAGTGVTVSNATSGAGSSQNMPPAIILNYIIKT